MGDSLSYLDNLLPVIVAFLNSSNLLFRVKLEFQVSPAQCGHFSLQHVLCNLRLS